MQKNRMIVVSLVSCVALVCGAADYKTRDSFVNLTDPTTGKGYATYWVQATNWTDLAGNAVDVPPTNSADTAYLTASDDWHNGKKSLRSIPLANNATIPTGGGNCTRIEFGRVWGDYRMILHMGTQNGNGFPAQTVSVADPDDFPGFWSTYTGRGNVELRATPEHSPALSHYDIAGYMGISVPDAGTSASVESLYRSGALRKTGAGELTVRQGAGGDSRVYCAEGSVTLNGLSDAVYDGALPKAWLHLDATRTDTMTTFAKDGRTCLSRWNDCDGGSVYMTTNFPSDRLGKSGMIPFLHPPYVAAATSPSGRALVDFGMSDLDVTSGLPSNCLMTASETLTTAKEFFFAAKSTSTNTKRDLRALVGALGVSQYLGYGHSHVFSTSYCNPTLVESRHVSFNGMQVHPLGLGSATGNFVTRFGTMPSDFSVIGFGSEADLKFDMVGSDGGYVPRTGGWQLGELLVYDRVLTDDERNRVTRYLMAKWQKDCRDEDVGELVLNDATSVSVPAGHTARVKSLSTQGTKIVKKGDGRLIVDGVAPSGVTLDIQGGSVSVATPATANAPAANPYFWIDATNTASLVLADDNEVGGTQYITRWNDCNGGSVYAELPLDEDPLGNGTKNVYLTDSRFIGHKPWIVKAFSPTGLDMIDFGALFVTPPTQSFMQLVPHGAANAYCGFIVVSAFDGSLAKQYFGTSNTDLLGLSANQLGSTSWMVKEALAANWTVDGRAVDPLANIGTLIANTDCHVIAFACQTAKLRADLLSKYTYNQEGSGSQKIGEMLLYDRILSAEERRNTEAYLMKKWLGKDHPESAAGFKATYAYPADKPIVVDADADVTIAAKGDSEAGVTIADNSGNGTFIKRGSGAATLADLSFVSNCTAFAAEGGSLAVTLDLVDDAYNRYDASDLDSFTSTYLTDDGNGGQTTNILKWADQVSGRIAQSAHIDGFSPAYGGLSGGTCTNPTLKYVTMPDGVARPTVDFGEYNNVLTIWKDQSSPVPLGTINSSAGMLLDGYNDTGKCKWLEAHAVFSDRPKDSGSGTENRMMIFTAKSANPVTLKDEGNLWRGSNGALFSGTSGQYVSAGVIHKDGIAVAHTEKLGEGFHLVSIQPTNYVNISAISLDRNCNAGGCRISEYVLYRTAHTPEVFAYIQGKLMRKWFGTAASRAPWVKSLTSLTAGAGATLTLSTEAKVAVAELAGAGTIDAPELTGVTSLALVAPSETLEVTGTVALADTGTVSFSQDLGRLDVGSYTVLSAGSIENAAAISNWTIDAEVAGRRRLRLAVEEGNLLLKVEKDGLIMFIR